MSTIDTTLPTYSGDVPDPDTQSQPTFDTNAVAWNNYIKGLVPYQNTWATEANALRTFVNSQRALSQEWASTTGALVDATDYSAKEWAVGAVVPGGSAKEWATATGSAVDSSEYSAKEYAIGTVVPAGSAKDWATQETGFVSGSEYSAKYHAGQAKTYSDIAGSAANYAGVWSALSGPLASGVTVVHADMRWFLTEAIALVENEEPGVSVKWLAIPSSDYYLKLATTPANSYFFGSL